MARRIGVAIERVEGGGGRRLGGSIIGHVPRLGRFSPENRRHLLRSVPRAVLLARVIIRVYCIPDEGYFASPEMDEKAKEDAC